MCGETLLTLPHDVQGKCCQLLQLWRDGTLWNSLPCLHSSQALLLARFVQVLGKDSSLCPGNAAQGEAAFWGQREGTDGSQCHQPLSLLECFLQLFLTQRSPAEFRLSGVGGKQLCVL